MTDSLFARQAKATIRIGEALGALKNVQTVLLLAIHSPFTRFRAERLSEVNSELEKAIAAIEAAVKEG